MVWLGESQGSAGAVTHRPVLDLAVGSDMGVAVTRPIGRSDGVLLGWVTHAHWQFGAFTICGRSALFRMASGASFCERGGRRLRSARDQRGM